LGDDTPTTKKGRQKGGVNPLFRLKFYLGALWALRSNKSKPTRSLVCSACFLEKTHCHESISDCTAGTKRRRDKHGFCNFFASRACFNCVVDVRLDAIGALGSQSYGHGHQFPILYRDGWLQMVRSDLWFIRTTNTVSGGQVVVMWFTAESNYQTCSGISTSL
jgi:hypothetical protein